MLRKALIVSEENASGPMLAEILRALCFEPTVLPKGKPAVAWAHEHQPELVFIDVAVTGADGYAICEDLKLDRATNRIPVILLTADGASADRVRGLQVGANSYVSKPWNEEQVNRAVHQAQAWRAQLESCGARGEIHFQLQSNTQYLEELNQLLSSLFLYSGLSRTQITHMITAVREIGLNAIEWGHRNQVEEILTVIYQIDPEKITIVIRDSGPGFDPKNLPHAARPEDPVSHLPIRESLGLREGGFGLLVARGLVDDLQFNPTGNEVKLVKYFPPQASGLGQERPAG